MDSAQSKPSFFERLLHPIASRLWTTYQQGFQDGQRTGAIPVRTAPEAKPEPQSTPPGGIIRVNAIRLKGYVRNQIEEMRVQAVEVHPPQYLLPPPAPRPSRQQTDAIHPLPPAPRHSDTLLTLPPARNPALHLTDEQRREAFSQMGTLIKRDAQPSELIVNVIPHMEQTRREEMPTLHGVDVQGDGLPDWVSVSRDELPAGEWINTNRAASAPLPPCVESIQYWTEVEELAQQSGLLPPLDDDTEGDTVQGPAVTPILHAKIARREVERRLRSLLPESEQGGESA